MKFYFAFTAICVLGIALGFSPIEELEITITIDGKDVDLKNGIAKEAVRGDLIISVTGDKYTYNISEFEVVLAEDDMAKRKETGKSGKISLKNFSDKAKKGDSLFIDR